jgi:hypothetical protein
MSDNTNKNRNDSPSGSSQTNIGFEPAAAVVTMENIITSETNRGTHSWLDTTAAKVGGALFAVAATLITAKDAVSRAFFKTVNKGENGAFADLQKIREEKIGAVLAKKGTGIDIPTEIGKISKQYDKELAARKAELGFSSIFKQAKVLKRHQWLEVAFATGAVASVAVGAIMAIASARGKVKKLEEHIAQKENTPDR